MRYDYKCINCGHIEEHQHGMKEAPKIMCPKCGYHMKITVTTARPVVFKGEGWTPPTKYS